MKKHENPNQKSRSVSDPFRGLALSCFLDSPGAPRDGRPPTIEAMIGNRPILLFGLPRSGTTWIAKIFDSHPDTLYRHEPDRRFLDSGLPVAPRLEDIAQRRDDALRYLETCLGRRREKQVGSPPLFAKSYRGPLGARARAGLVYGIKGLSRWVPRLAGSIPVPDLIDGAARARVRLVWKSVVATTHLPAYARLMPEARCILILRHPGGQIDSEERGRTHGYLEAAEGSPAEHLRWLLEPVVASGLGARLGLTYDDIERAEPWEQAVYAWAFVNEFAIEGIADLRNCRVVRYEDVAADPEAMARELFAFAQLEWDPQTAAFIAASARGGAGRRSAYFGLYRDSRAEIDKWRQRLSAERAARLGAIARRFAAGRLYAEVEAHPAAGRARVSRER
jgi:hypothetical protein